MKQFILAAIIQFVLLSACLAQYDAYRLVFSGGINACQYLGEGEEGNYFKFKSPGFQVELAINTGEGFEWIIWGFNHFKSINVVENNEVPVEFFIPYYTEFSFYQKDKKNPLFFFIGYDYARMKFLEQEMDKPDSQHNITFGGGWNIKLFNPLFVQFKVKPYFIIGNSIGQWYGLNIALNLHFGVLKN